MKPLLLSILISIIMVCLHMPACSAWTEYMNVRYMDFDGDLVDEIIIEARHGAGSGHYIKDMRIFKDEYPELELIFTIRTLDSYFGLGLGSQYEYDIVSDVEITEPNLENGTRDIIVKSKKIYYKDDENKTIDKEEELGIKIFKWDGKTFVETEMSNQK